MHKNWIFFSLSLSHICCPVLKPRIGSGQACMVIEIPYFIRTDPNCGEKKEQICRDAVEKSDPACAEMKRKTTRAQIEMNAAVWEM